ncbi:sigma-70 family RNA polymerase sigma factor [Pendulispora rubella]|uniref:Sigma-70 family RNA polymerase sigma factor n=1 Tax=Pendulispora rubella TaxID=2741070 RepID=A0ABZ2KXF9_9BACT
MGSLEDDLQLASACLGGDRSALATFERAHLREIGAFVAHIDRAPAFADEVRQVLRASLLVAGQDGHEPGLAGYRGRGSLGGFVRVAAVRTALNLKRQARRASAREEAAGTEGLAAASVSPELAYAREQYREAFGEALRATIAELSARDRTLLRLYHAEGVALEALAALYRVHLSTVSRWLTCAREQLSEATLRRLRERLRVGPSDAESIAALLMSQLDVSLVRLFREAG